MAVNKRVRYWEAGAAAVRRLGGPYKYACPLCRHLFGPDQIDRLSLDHVPPKSVGGKLEVLTCRRCDNTAGHELDAHAHRFDLFRRIVAGEPYPAVPARITVEGISANVKLQSDGALNNIRVLPGNPPSILDQLPAAFDRLVRERSKLRLTMPMLKDAERRARVSYLRAGYLAAFAFFGYSVVQWPSFDQIRRQICEPDVEHINGYFFYRHDQPLGNEVAVVVEPEWHSSIIVLMGCYQITLPLNDDTSLYERIAQEAAVGVHAELRSRRFGWPRRPAYALDWAAPAVGQA